MPLSSLSSSSSPSTPQRQVVVCLFMVFVVSLHHVETSVHGFTATMTKSSSRSSNLLSTSNNHNFIPNSLLHVPPVSNMETEDDAKFIMQKAKDCAYGTTEEECLLEDPDFWLQQVLHVQSGCVTGTLADAELCENHQDEVADIVAHLRQKKRVRQQEEILNKGHPIPASSSNKSVVPLVATELIMISLFLVVATFWTTLDMSDRHGMTSVATIHEWWDSIQNDNYVPSMLAYHFGIMGTTGTAASDSATTIMMSEDILAVANVPSLP